MDYRYQWSKFIHCTLRFIKYNHYDINFHFGINVIDTWYINY